MAGRRSHLDTGCAVPVRLGAAPVLRHTARLLRPAAVLLWGVPLLAWRGGVLASEMPPPLVTHRRVTRRVALPGLERPGAELSQGSNGVLHAGGKGSGG